MTAAAQPSTPAEEVFFEGRPALITLGLWLVARYWRTLGCHYRVTSRRIVVETGVLSKRLEQVDLYRVNDYTVERPFLQRLMGTGNLLLKTMDKTTPEVNLVGLKTDVVALYERLRVATEAD